MTDATRIADELTQCVDDAFRPTGLDGGTIEKLQALVSEAFYAGVRTQQRQIETLREALEAICNLTFSHTTQGAIGTAQVIANIALANTAKPGETK